MNVSKPFEVEVTGEKYYILVVGIKFAAPKTLKHVLNTASRVEKEHEAHVVLVSPKVIATEIHGILATKYALKSFRYGLNVAKNLNLETLVYIAANRQIKEAIKIAGPSDEFSTIVAVIFSRNIKSLNNALGQLLKQEQGTLDNSLLRITEDKANYIREAFSIKDEELKATLARNKEEALIKCVLSRLAMLHVKK